MKAIDVCPQSGKLQCSHLVDWREMIMSIARVFVCALVASAGTAYANTYSFLPLTNFSATNSAAGVAQLFVDVSSVSATQIAFTFRNVGPAASSITDVYFDDGAYVSGMASISSMPGVSFSPNASPPNVPGANNASPAFSTTVGLSADSNPPAQPNGVNPGEQVVLTLNLQHGKTFADVIAAMNMPRDNFRVAMHVQGFANGGSESFIHNVPTPGTLALMGLGGLLAACRRRA